MAKSEKSKLRRSNEIVERPLALTWRRSSSGGRKYEGGDEGEAKRRIWREPLAKRRQPTIFFSYVSRQRRASSAFPSFFLFGISFLSRLCPTSLLGFALVAFHRCFDSSQLEFCPPSIDSSSFVDKIYVIFKKRDGLLFAHKRKKNEPRTYCLKSYIIVRILKCKKNNEFLKLSSDKRVKSLFNFIFKIKYMLKYIVVFVILSLTCIFFLRTTYCIYLSYLRVSCV